jgi:hypothetical protein
VEGVGTLTGLEGQDGFLVTQETHPGGQVVKLLLVHRLVDSSGHRVLGPVGPVPDGILNLVLSDTELPEEVEGDVTESGLA